MTSLPVIVRHHETSEQSAVGLAQVERIIDAICETALPALIGKALEGTTSVNEEDIRTSIRGYSIKRLVVDLRARETIDIVGDPGSVDGPTLLNEAMRDAAATAEDDVTIHHVTTDRTGLNGALWWGWKTTSTQAQAGLFHIRTEVSRASLIPEDHAHLVDRLAREAPPRSFLAIAEAIEAGAYHWLAARAGTPDHPAQWLIRAMALAVGGVASHLDDKGQKPAVLDRLNREVHGVHGLKVNQIRKELLKRQIVTTSRELVFPRIIRVPALLASTMDRIKFKRSGKRLQYELQLGEPSHAPGKQLSIFADTEIDDENMVSDASIMPFIIDDLRQGVSSPYCLDFFLAILVAITEHIQADGSPEAAQKPTRVTWADIERIIGWKRPKSVTTEARQGLMRMCRYILSHPLRISGAGGESYDGALIKIDMKSNSVSRSSDPEANVFTVGDFTLAKPFADAIFRRNDQPALVNAANVFSGGGLDITGKNAARLTVPRQQYQLLSVLIDSRTRESLLKKDPERRGWIRLTYKDIEYECGIGIQVHAPDGKKPSASSVSNAKKRRHEVIVRALERMVEVKHIIRFEVHDIRDSHQRIVDREFEIRVGTDMEEAHTKLLVGERDARLERTAHKKIAKKPAR